MMTNKRSDELRRKHGCWSPHRDHHPVGSIADAGLDVIECLDALDAMTAECDRLQSRLEAPAVVVPELTTDDAHRELLRVSHGRTYSAEQEDSFRDGYDFARTRAIPADRALGDGMVAVDREEWDAVQAFASVWFAGRPDGEVHDASSAWHSRRQALRANQGGAEHGKV